MKKSREKLKAAIWRATPNAVLSGPSKAVERAFRSLRVVGATGFESAIPKAWKLCPVK